MIGDVVFARFPLSDHPRFKTRPCLVISEADAFGDIEVLKITSKRLKGEGRLRLSPDDFIKGGLDIPSAIVPGDIAKTHTSTLVRYAGQLRKPVVQTILKTRISSASRTFSRLAHVANRPGDDPVRLASEAEEDRRWKMEAGANQDPSSPPQSAISNIPSPRTRSVPYAGRVFTEDEVEAAVSATLDFWLTLGPEGEAMERELAQFLGVKRSLLVNSGSSANLLALSALTSHKLPAEKRILPGDEVITCAAGFPTTVAPIIQSSAVAVFIDNNPVTGNADVDQLAAAFSPGKTKAVMLAHALGNPFDLGAVLAFCREHDLWLIEDNCDALGCRYTLPAGNALNPGETALTRHTGTWGDLSTQSFYPPHHITTGEGGAVNIVRDMRLKVQVESLRDWGRDCWCASGQDNTCNKRFGWQLGELPEGYDHKYIYSHLGYNLKPLDPQAAIGRQQIKKLPSFVEARKRNWETLRRGLADLEEFFEFSLPTHATGWSPDGFAWDATGCRTECSWFGFLLLVRESAPFNHNQLARALDDAKIGNRMFFGGNLLRQPAFLQLRQDRPETVRVAAPLTGADRIMNEALFLGTYPGLTPVMLDYEIEALQRFVKAQT